MKFSRIIFAFLLILLFSCELEKSNPLDPDNGGEIPSRPIIDNLLYNNEVNPNRIELYWEDLNTAAGINIYRSLYLDGEYQIIETYNAESENFENRYFFDTNIYHGNTYYYKLSAFNEKGMEGRFSQIERIKIQ